MPPDDFIASMLVSLAKMGPVGFCSSTITITITIHLQFVFNLFAINLPFVCHLFAQQQEALTIPPLLKCWSPAHFAQVKLQHVMKSYIVAVPCCLHLYFSTLKIVFVLIAKCICSFCSS